MKILDLLINNIESLEIKINLKNDENFVIFEDDDVKIKELLKSTSISLPNPIDSIPNIRDFSPDPITCTEQFSERPLNDIII